MIAIDFKKFLGGFFMTRVKSNLDVRECAKKSGVYLWQIAAAIGVSEPTFNRRMRFEMSEAEKEQVKQIIDRIADKLNGGAAG